MQEFLRMERCVVLWLVPTNTIREQTLKALRDLKHPYRQALQESIGGGPLTVKRSSSATCRTMSPRESARAANRSTLWVKVFSIT